MVSPTPTQPEHQSLPLVISDPEPTGSFLTAQWRDLVMVNYEVAPQLLASHIPRGTSLDLWCGKALISLVGFRFLKTRVLGIPFPGHRDFNEVNLRCYVVRDTPQGPKRGVVFIKEIVPKPIIAWVARTLYNENYVALPMRHTDQTQECGEDANANCRRLEYQWQANQTWNAVSVRFSPDWQVPDPDSEASFIAEHYWGYTKMRNGSTAEYQVEHPPWAVAQCESATVSIRDPDVYGEKWREVLHSEPTSAFVAQGSDIRVRWGRRLSDTRKTQHSEDSVL